MNRWKISGAKKNHVLYVPKLSNDKPISDYAYGMNEIDKKGFIFDPIDIKTGYGITIPSGYIYERWSNYFELGEIMPVGMNNSKIRLSSGKEK